MLETPENLRTLQRKLYIKAKQAPAYRFYALYDKMWREDILLFAYRLVRANKGSPGIDGMNFEDIEQKTGIDKFLLELAQDLKDKTYRPNPVRRVMIPKADGTMRPLGIPTIRDRVAQMAVKLIIEPIFEADFCPNSYGFRPKKSAHDAVDEITNALHQGYTCVIDADLSKYFDSIPHAKLMAVVAERIVDGAVLHLIKQWLKTPVISEDKDGVKRNVGGGKGNSLGTPQGGVISPLLANCYLHVLDRIWERHHLCWKLQARIIRYADDFVVMCRGKADMPLATVKHVLERLDLTLNETKTHIVDARNEPFNLLGFKIRVGKSWKTGKSYTHRSPSPKSLAKIKDRITQLTARERTPIPLEHVIGSVNSVLRGWVNYFHYGNSSQALERVKWHTEERMRTHLMKRHKVKDRGAGLGRFPSQQLYTKYGLYKVPTTAGWKKVHALV
ncbi:group II intron reverse transcriptase/maturase [Methylomarinum vadi]|uniref:group II intron reverse transcriptase/maturase n=1 Tax=Methylomarinum vadi TaxID=438855 RepID=UPI0004DF207B|nr:group II intron reverse transcriptase/maturase [Methylomarinum vadi]